MSPRTRNNLVFQGKLRVADETNAAASLLKFFVFFHGGSLMAFPVCIVPQTWLMFMPLPSGRTHICTSYETFRNMFFSRRVSASPFFLPSPMPLSNKAAPASFCSRSDYIPPKELDLSRNRSCFPSNLLQAERHEFSIIFNPRSKAQRISHHVGSFGGPAATGRRGRQDVTL